MARRRKPAKNVRRRILFKVGGRTVKTVRDRITEGAAARELGRELLGVDVEVWLKRRLGRSVRVEIGYTLLGSAFDVEPMVRRLGLSDFVKGAATTL